MVYRKCSWFESVEKLQSHFFFFDFDPIYEFRKRSLYLYIWFIDVVCVSLSVSSFVPFSHRKIRWYARLGRTDFVGGIDNEALDFGQLESFVHLPTVNTSNNNANQSAITLAITTVSTAPAHTITTTASASVAPSNAPTHGQYSFIIF